MGVTDGVIPYDGETGIRNYKHQNAGTGCGYRQRRAGNDVCPGLCTVLQLQYSQGCQTLDTNDNYMNKKTLLFIMIFLFISTTAYAVCDDTDSDSICNDVDNCPTVSNHNRAFAGCA